jgi:hypothetical protein
MKGKDGQDSEKKRFTMRSPMYREQVVWGAVLCRWKEKKSNREAKKKRKGF